MTPFWTSASFPENCCRGCQAASPGASQPWWNWCSLAYRGVATIYYLGIVSIDIYSIYRYLQQHCVMAETHHSQLSAAREVGKNYQTLVNKFFSLWISNQDCVLCLVFFVSLYKHRHHKAVVCHYLFPPVRYLWSVLYWVHWLLGAAPVSSSQNLPVSPVHSGYTGECQHRTTAGTMTIAQVDWLH